MCQMASLQRNPQRSQQIRQWMAMCALMVLQRYLTSQLDANHITSHRTLQTELKCIAEMQLCMAPAHLHFLFDYTVHMALARVHMQSCKLYNLSFLQADAGNLPVLLYKCCCKVSDTIFSIHELRQSSSLGL